jgi:NAD-dependent dihydropyrimidine dehydrogenase PreA subunit
MPFKNPYKLFFQAGVMALLIFMAVRLFSDAAYTPDFEAFCPFGGLLALGSFLERHSLSCSMTSVQVAMGLALMAGVVLFSKLFCGYLCPPGTLGEWIGRAGEKLGIRITLKGFADKSLRSMKYILLVATFYFTLTSSELFCKKYDPYYAVASGFNTDVVLFYALISLGGLVTGSFFLRLFWCRYFCPLGALSNIFRFTWWFAGIVALFILLRFSGIRMPLIFPLLIIAAGGYLLEISGKESAIPSLVRITRNKTSCTGCKKCSSACPQGIDVSRLESINHIDCNLCGDCLQTCPEKNTLLINRREMKWLPAAMLSILIIAGFISGRSFELPTIDLKWGTEKQIAGAGVFTMEGLKNIKCYGSSAAFAGQLQKSSGIFGVATFTGSHSVRILYDTTVYDEQKLRELIFIPYRKILRQLPPGNDSVAVFSFTIDNFFDPLDASCLQILLEQMTSACGFQSEYGCPVKVSIYFPASASPRIPGLVEIIESGKIACNIPGNTFNVKPDYRVITRPGKPEFISRAGFFVTMLMNND